MRLRAETFILLSSFHSSGCSELLYMYRGESNLKEETGVRNLTFHVPHWIPTLGHREMRIWGFSTYQEAIKKNVSLPLDCFSSRKKQFLAPVKAFIFGKRRQRTNRWLIPLLQTCPAGN